MKIQKRLAGASMLAVVAALGAPSLASARDRFDRVLRDTEPRFIDVAEPILRFRVASQDVWKRRNVTAVVVRRR